MKTKACCSVDKLLHTGAGTMSHQCHKTVNMKMKNAFWALRLSHNWINRLIYVSSGCAPITLTLAHTHCGHFFTLCDWLPSPLQAFSNFNIKRRRHNRNDENKCNLLLLYITKLEFISLSRSFPIFISYYHRQRSGILGDFNKNNKNPKTILTTASDNVSNCTK